MLWLRETFAASSVISVFAPFALAKSTVGISPGRQSAMEIDVRDQHGLFTVIEHVTQETNVDVGSAAIALSQSAQVADATSEAVTITTKLNMIASAVTTERTCSWSCASSGAASSAGRSR